MVSGLNYCVNMDIMSEKFKKIMLFFAFSLPIIGPGIAFADFYGGWNYHGSGRDHPYSEYIDRDYTIGYADYAPIEPAYVDWRAYVNDTPIPAGAVGQNEFTVNIPNKNGGYTAVIIKRSGNGYVGPQGEYYPQFPKVSQLQVMYGK
jgi:hypothetical protein